MHASDPGLNPSDTPFVSPEPEAAPRLALRIMQLGAVAVVLVAATWRTFELDRFYAPKELVLHLTALICGILVVRAFRRITWTWIDTALLAFTGIGIVSAVFAQNGWLATRALTIGASAVVVFWIGRVLRERAQERALIAGVAVAVLLGIGTSLLQAYGVELDVFSINRAPGGTLGNRNSIAHMAAFGLPIMLFLTLSTQRVVIYALGAVGSTLLVATLVLTRSRAGWLAVAAALVVFIVCMLLSAALRRGIWLRLAGVIALAAAGVAGAVLVPNSLRWVDENPYLSSVRDVANYREGSGAGRLVQYRRTLAMAVSDPVLGVGPGNWAVAYPEYAEGGDPSMDRSEGGRTSNPWPSSDWVAFTAERGFPAMLLLVATLGGIALATLRRLRRTEDHEDALQAVTLLATLVAAVVAGVFDAVLLLALPALLVWAVVGALWAPQSGRALQYAPFALAALLVVSALGAVRSTSELVAMGIYENSTSNSWLRRAAWIDPGNYRLRIRLARPGSGLPRAERCGHARAARDLYPSATQARSLARSCD